MANIKISQLPSLATLADTTVFSTVDSGVNYKSSALSIKNYITWPVTNTTGSNGPTNIAIGQNAGAYGNSNVAIGIGAAGTGNNIITIGTNAGQGYIGNGSILIGPTGSVSANSLIVFNATGNTLTPVSAQNDSFYVAPIRNNAGTSGVLQYNSTTKEVTYGNAITIGSKTWTFGSDGALTAPGNITSQTLTVSNGNAGFESQLFVNDNSNNRILFRNYNNRQGVAGYDYSTYNSGIVVDAGSSGYSVVSGENSGSDSRTSFTFDFRKLANGTSAQRKGELRFESGPDNGPNLSNAVSMKFFPTTDAESNGTFWTFGTDGTLSSAMFLAKAEIFGATGYAGYSFTGDGGLDTGMFSAGDGNIQFYSNATKVVEIASGNITLLGHPTIEGVTSTGATGTGKLVFDNAPTISGHPTIEGVTSTGATGTGKLVFDNAPTFSGTVTTSTLTVKDVRDTVYAATFASTFTPDGANGALQTVTLTGSITINAFANPVAGQTITLILTQGGSGSYTLTSSMKFAGGLKTLSTAVGSVDLLTITYTGSVYYASLVVGFV
jgi:hypothetical protein